MLMERRIERLEIDVLKVETGAVQLIKGWADECALQATANGGLLSGS